MSATESPHEYFSASAQGAALEEQQFLDDLRVLVMTESPSQDLVAVERSAQVVSEIIRRRLGREPERIEVDGVTHVRLRGRDPAILLVAHHDTVWPLGTIDEIPFSIEDGIIKGPGSFDMKVGLLQAIYALARHPELIERVCLLVTGDEEVGSISSRSMIELEAQGCQAALVFEAAADGGALKVGRKGVSLYRVHVEGRAAHAGLEPERGVNAGVAIAELVTALAHLGDPAVGTTVTPTRIEAGTTGNTVPAHGYVVVDARACTRKEQDRVDRAIKHFRSSVPGAIVSVEGGLNRPPLERSATDGLFERARAMSLGLGLGEIAGVEVGGGSDGNFTAGVGIPTLDGMGAVGGGAHARDEHALLGFVQPRIALAAALISELACDPRSQIC